MSSLSLPGRAFRQTAAALATLSALAALAALTALAPATARAGEAPSPTAARTASASPQAAVGAAATDAAVTAPTWAQAVDHAWQRSPGGRAQAARRVQLQARQDEAGAWLAETPAVTLSDRSDRWQADHGRREWEAELDLPLRLPGVRRATQAAAQAQGDAAQARWAADRLALAGEVREAAWALRLALVDHQAAGLRADEAQALARDVARRVAAGDLARLDGHRADAAAQQALAAVARAEATLLRARSAYQALTGQSDPPADEEPLPDPAAGLPIDHPLLQAARLAARQARADLALAEAANGGSPALVVGLTRERDGFNDPSATTTRIGLRWPLASELRNRLGTTAALADLAQAEGEADALQARLAADVQAAQAEHEQALRVRQLARTQAALTQQAQALVARAFELGEADLPTRLRSDAEHRQALLDARRAELEAGLTVSRLRQALGLLPAGPTGVAGSVSTAPMPGGASQ